MGELTSAVIYISAPLLVWRLSKAVTEEEGPFSIFTWMHMKVTQKTWLGRGLWCLWCVSFWIGPLVALFLTETFWDALLIGWAWSALAILFDKVIEAFGDPKV